MGKVKTAAAIAVFVVAFGIAGRMDKQDAERADNPPVMHKDWGIEEDSPFWSCATMGNYRCGHSSP